jgi:putative inorganic carbon (HCO3(-)) transporter
MSLRGSAFRVLLVGLGMGVAIMAGLQTVAEPSRSLILILAGAIVGATLLVLAYTRFEVFLLLALAIRASVDWTQTPSETAVGEPTTSGVETTVFALIFLIASVLWLLVQLQVGRLRRPSSLSIAWLAFAGIGLLSALGADVPIESLAESGRIATVVVMLVVLEQVLSTSLPVRRLLTICYLSAIVPLLMAAYQVVTGAGGSATFDGISRVRGTFLHPNAFGFYLVILIIMGVALLPYLTRRVRPLLLSLVWVSTTALVLTYSRGSWIVLVVGLVVVAKLQSPSILVLMLAATAALAITVPSVSTRLLDLQTDSNLAGVQGNSLQWRLDYWSTAIGLADESPAIGIGPKMTQYSTHEAKVPHNDILRAYVETGVLGLIAYAAIIAMLIRTARNAVRNASSDFDKGVGVGFAGCAAAFISYSFGGNLMSQVVVLWYFVAFAAAAITVARSATQPANHVHGQRRPMYRHGSRRSVSLLDR